MSPTSPSGDAPTRSVWGRLGREPLLHFALLGGALFAVAGLRPEAAPDAPQPIVVTQGLVDHLSLGFERTWGRPPREDELAGLVRDRVLEEAMVREARALGLDRDDPVIRRRLRQKLEFVAADVAEATEPDEATLRAHHAARAEVFAEPPRVDFRHVFFDVDARGNVAGDVDAALSRLNAEPPADPETLGDRFLLGSWFEALPPTEVAALFGAGFADGLAALPTGSWQGPLASGYGLHLVRVDARTPARSQPFEEVRERVRLDWREQRRLSANAAWQAALLERHQAVFELDGPPPDREAP